MAAWHGVSSAAAWQQHRNERRRYGIDGGGSGASWRIMAASMARQHGAATCALSAARQWRGMAAWLQQAARHQRKGDDAFATETGVYQ